MSSSLPRGARAAHPRHPQRAIALQVIAGAAAALPYQDPQKAKDDGYVQVSQYVPGLGIHLVNDTYQTTYTTFYDPGGTNDQLRHPVGLRYSETSPGSGIPDVLVGTSYTIPNDEVCAFYSMPLPCQDPVIQPVGFDTTNSDADNLIWGFQRGWHRLWGLCLKDRGTSSAEQWVLGPGTQGGCLASPYNGTEWFAAYGWTLDVHNFVPNPDGRFKQFNVNADFP